MLWSLFFNMTDTREIVQTRNLPTNLFVVGGPDGGLDFEHSIDEVCCLQNACHASYVQDDRLTIYRMYLCVAAI